MSGESDGFQDAVIQDYLNDTGSELSSLSHLDAPSESVYMICGVLIAMLLVGFIIILLAVTIRFKSPTRSVSCKNCRNICCISKLRKREESSGVHRTNVVHPEGVIQGVIVGLSTESQSEVTKVPSSSPPLEDIITTTPYSNRSSTGSSTCQESDCSMTSIVDNLSTTASSDSYYPMFLYSTGNSRNSLNISDQGTLVHPSGPAEDLENNNSPNNNKEDIGKKNIKGKLRKLVKRKPPTSENYALPLYVREQLKEIYVY